MIQIQTANTGRKYWRSLDELANTPDFQRWVHKEFPDGAAEMLDGSSRRTLLKLMGASFGLAGLVGCRRPVQHILPNAKGIEDYIPGKAYFYATSFSHAGYGSGLLVETHDGRPTKIEGNPDHPYSLGAASAFAQASVLDLYDPDRSTSVLHEGKAVDAKEFASVRLGDAPGLRFLSERITSPSLAALKTATLQKYPAAKWVEFDPISNENTLVATQAAFGQSLEPQYRFDKADVILALDADFLGLDSPTILPVKQFAAKRKVLTEEDRMNRLYAVESHYSLTGANADHRLRLRASEIPQFAEALVSQVSGLTGITPPGASGKWLAAVAKDLLANKGRCVVVAGARQDVATHIAAFQLNEALGNVGSTVSYAETRHKPSLAAFKELAGEMAAGQVGTLVILGGNPVFTAPADLQFEANLKKVATSIHLGLQPDETAYAAKWHVPQAHYLEAWGDCVSPDGSASIQQPMIEPLHGGRTASELLAVLIGNKEQTAYDIVRKYWSFNDAKWRKALHDGVVEGVKSAEVKAAVTKGAGAQSQKPAGGGGMEVSFVPSSNVYDGRYANNGWLHETPDPMTKVVWGNVALLSAATAKQLGVVDGDVLSLKHGGASVECPAMIQPGHADQSITVSLGYGRSKIGQVGTGIGHNVYPLRTTDGFHYLTGVDVSKTGRFDQIATTQNYHSMDTVVKLPNGQEIHEVRPVVREATLAEYRKNPKVIEERQESPELFSLYGEHFYDKGYQWGMTIDLHACIGCNACMVACQAENNIPIVGKAQVLKGRDMAWIRLDRYFSGDQEDPRVVYQPMACQQCQNAPCENVCPVAATIHSPEGLNDMAYNRCVGTRYCANNCPYKVRRFNFLNWHKDEQEVHRMVFNPDVTVRMRGVMEKCTYCVQRIQEKKIEAKVDGRRQLRDGEVVPACEQTCPADAITFGNLLDKDSRVAQLKKQERNYALLEELNVKPRTTYLARLRNPNPELSNG